MWMELGGAVRSLCLERVVQHGSSEEKQEGSGEEMRKGKQEKQEVSGPMTALSQRGMSTTVLTTQCFQRWCNPAPFPFPKTPQGGAEGDPDRSVIHQPAAEGHDSVTL